MTTILQKQKGFTIVELLIVIVVIGVLAAITIVAYNGIQARAENTKTANGVGAYVKSMMAYAQINGTYPGAGNYRCVKDDKDNNLCSQVGTQAATCFGRGSAARNSSFDSDISTIVNTLPTVSSQSMTCGGQPYRGAFVGTSTDGKGGNFEAYYKGNVTCPSIGSLTNSNRTQQDDVTWCYYALPSL